MSSPESRYQPPPQTWRRKFECAVLGIGVGMWRQSSFHVHVVSFLLVLILGFTLQVAAWEWVALLFACGLVLVTELINSAMEALAKATTNQYCPHVDRSLKIASGAVLMAAFFAIAIGTIIFAPYLLSLFETSDPTASHFAPVAPMAP